MIALRLTLCLVLFALPLLSFPIPPVTVHPADELQFGKLWPQIKRFQDSGALDQLIAERQKEITQTTEHWKEKIPLLGTSSFLDIVRETLQSGTLTRSEDGCGSTYILKDRQGICRYVVKPFDEDLLCLNHPRHFASPFNDRAIRVRPAVPLYKSAQTEALAYQVACLLGLAHTTPETHIGVLTHEAFFDIEDRRLPKDKKRQKEKLCSIQTYHEELISLFSLATHWIEKETPNQELISQIDRKSFEELVLLIWVLCDTDGHPENIFAVGKTPYKFIKIDNGLSFPETNGNILNALACLPHASFSLSPEAKDRIMNLPIKAIEDAIRLYERDDALRAFNERIAALQELARTDLTIQEIDTHLKFLRSREE